MERAVIVTTPEIVRHVIADLALSANEIRAADGGRPVGMVELHPHQTVALSLVQDALTEFGGALLADGVGLGKTFVALAAARDAHRLLVVAPAALRGMWTASAMRAGRSALDFVSFEQLSRSDPAFAHALDFIVVDEAHHVRTPSTARYHRLAALAAAPIPVLLLSATPVHNHPGDLTALLAIFLGARSHSLSDAELARCVIRRERIPPTGSLPRVATPEWLYVGDASPVLDALLALPPPVPLAGGGDGGALVVHALVRQWASSDAALHAALRRRLAAAVAVAASLACGRHPSPRELASWSYADGAVQLGFPELLASPVAPGGSVAALAGAVAEHEAGLRNALHALVAGPGLDDARAGWLRALRARHPGEKIVAFSAYAATVASLGHALRGDAGVSTLTSTSARVAGGSLTRREALARFAPHASGAPPPAPAERIDLLLTTDLLSEGVNLQDASVVVHLDLPWTAARLEQRVGRAARLGAARPMVAVYALAPPASATRLLETERVIRRKLAAARRLVGVAGAILPPALDAAMLAGPHSEPDTSAANAAELVRSALERWRCASASHHDVGARPGMVVAATHSPRSGFVAALEGECGCALVAGAADGSVSDAPAAVLAAIRCAGGTACAVDGDQAGDAIAAIHRWRARAAARTVAGVVGGIADGVRRRLVARIATITRRAAAHELPLIAPLAIAARAAVAVPCGSGAERVLGELAGADSMADDAWLRAVATFGTVHARPAAAPRAEPARIVALLLLVAREAPRQQPEDDAPTAIGIPECV